MIIIYCYDVWESDKRRNEERDMSFSLLWFFDDDSSLQMQENEKWNDLFLFFFVLFLSFFFVQISNK